jgi:hypothetical protein
MNLSSTPHALHGLSNTFSFTCSCWKVQIMKFPLMQFSSLSCYFFSLRSKYSPLHPVLRHLQSRFYTWSERLNFTDKITGTIVVSCAPVFMLLGKRWEVERTEWQQAFPKYNLLFQCNFSLVQLLQNILSFLYCQRIYLLSLYHHDFPCILLSGH